MTQAGVVRVEDGSSETGNELRKLLPALGRVCMALLGDADAVTAALERVARDAAAKRPEAGTSPRVFLMGLAHRACTMHLSRLSQLSRPTDPAGAASTASGVARGSLARLRPTEREAVVLHVLGGLDASEIAAARGLETDVVRARLAAGLVRLAAEKEKSK